MGACWSAGNERTGWLASIARVDKTITMEKGDIVKIIYDVKLGNASTEAAVEDKMSVIGNVWFW